MLAQHRNLIWSAILRAHPPPPPYEREDLKGPVMLEIWRQMEEHGCIVRPGKIYQVANNEVQRLTREATRWRQAAARRCVPALFTDFIPPDLDLRRALLAVPEDARLLLTLYCLEGWTMDEIGALLGVGDDTVARRLKRACSQARTAMEGRRILQPPRTDEQIAAEFERRAVDLARPLPGTLCDEIGETFHTPPAYVRKVAARLRRERGIAAKNGRRSTAIEPGQVCSVEGCEGKRYVRGMCSRHYQQWKKAKQT